MHLLSTLYHCNSIVSVQLTEGGNRSSYDKDSEVEWYLLLGKKKKIVQMEFSALKKADSTIHIEDRKFSFRVSAQFASSPDLPKFWAVKTGVGCDFIN